MNMIVTPDTISEASAQAADATKATEAVQTSVSEISEEPASAQADEAAAVEAVTTEAVSESVSEALGAVIPDGDASAQNMAPSSAVDSDAVAPDEPDEVAEEDDGVVNMEHLRMAEALLFASAEPLDAKTLAASMPEGAKVTKLLPELQKVYEKRGVTLVNVAGKWQFRTAPDLAFLLRKEKPEQKRLSRAAIETLAIVAYHQPVTRAEIEDIRGVALSKGTLDALLEIGWVKIRGRRRTPGRPVTYGTTEAFLVQFGLENIGVLPGMDELKAAGFLEAIPPSGFDIPAPSEELAPDEDPYEGEEEGDVPTDDISPADMPAGM